MSDWQYPIKALHENLVLRHDNQVMAFYKVPSLSFAVSDGKGKANHRQATANVLRKMIQNKSFEISMIPKDFLLAEKMRDLVPSIDEEKTDIGISFFERTIEALNDEMYIPYQYEWLIGVPLTKERNQESFRAALKDKMDGFITSGVSLFGYEMETKTDWYEDYEESNQAVYQSLSSLRARKISQEENFYNQRLQFLRYIPHEKEEVTASHELLNVTDSKLEVLTNGIVKLISPFGEAYLSILPVAHIPKPLNFYPVAEVAKSFNFPVELRFKCHVPEVSGANGIKNKMGRSRVRVSNIVEEAYNAGSTQQDRIIEIVESMEPLEKDVGAKEPLFEWGAFFIVAGNSLEQVKNRKRIVLSSFQNMKIQLAEASFDTPYLFQSLLYSNGLDVNLKKWPHLTNAEGLADMMFFTDSKLGSSTGYYIGRVDNNFGRWSSIREAIQSSKSIVLTNLALAVSENVPGKLTKNPHVEITGPTGGGKSYLMQLLFLNQSLLHKTLYIDPKSQMKAHWLSVIHQPGFKEQYPDTYQLIHQMNFVTLDRKEEANHGVLDPIVMLKGEDAVETAKSMIAFLSESPLTKTEYTALSKSIRETVEERAQGEAVGMAHVVQKMREDKEREVQKFGDFIYEMTRGTLLDLAFSDGKGKSLDYNAKNTVLEIAGLSLPKAGTTKMTDHERNSVILMFALGAFCKTFGEQNSHEFTFEFIDESWIFEKSSEGRKVLMSMRRVGRSMENSLVLCTQSVNDSADSDDTTGFGSLFMFYEPAEAEAILKRLDLEVNEQNLEWLSNMATPSGGQCLYKDIFGNLNRLSVETLFPEWHALFSPMKETSDAMAENKYA